MDSPRIVIMGVGSIGSRHVDNLLSMGYEDMVGIDTRPMPNDERLPIVTCFEDLSTWRPTHAVVCTPPDQHYHHARYFLESGIPTFIEKPMTVKAAEAVSLATLADAAGTYIGVGYMERANPVVRKARHFAKTHAIKNAYIECHWQATPKTYDLNFLHESSHAIDTALFVAGEDLALVLNKELDGAPAYHDALLVGPSGAMYNLIMNAQSIPMRRINLYATNGEYFGEQYGLDQAEWDACYKAELQAFLDGRPLCAGTDGVAVMEILEQLG